MIFDELDIILQSVHVFVACVALAFVEIQIEGPHGWAKNLPTWRGQPTWASQSSALFSLMRSLFRWFSGGNELTGYHLSLMSFLFVIMLFPVTFAHNRLATLLLCIGWLSIMSVVWDFLWFVFNAAYGIDRFKQSHIAWHPRWLGPVPVAYYVGLFNGALFIVLGAGDPRVTWPLGLMALGVQLFGTFLAVSFMRFVTKK